MTKLREIIPNDSRSSRGHQIVSVIVENRRLSSYRRGSSSVSFIARVNDGAAFVGEKLSHNRAHMSEICIWCYSIYDNDYVSATPTDGDLMIISSFAMKTINELLSVYRRAKSRSSESGILVVSIRFFPTIKFFNSHSSFIDFFSLTSFVTNQEGNFFEIRNVIISFSL